MKLVTFGGAFGTEVGILAGDGVISLHRADPHLPTDMMTVINHWNGLKKRVHEIAETVSPHVAVADVRLRQPILRPGKILAIGKNYADHAKEMGSAPPTKQIWFSKHGTAANGPGDPIDIPKVSAQIDYEAELVVVIGKGGRHIAAEDALDHIFGYCCGNDISVRDWQNMTGQWMLGKSFDTHAPFGPYLSTSDEVADPQSLGIRCLVNGEVRQASNTANMIFPIAAQIAWVSQVMTLEPGDIIFTGTPEGVAMGMKEPRWLEAGDVVRVEIDGLGALENPMRAEP